MIQQRQFLSQNDKEFQFINKDTIETVQPLIFALHSNILNLGLYAKARIRQTKEVTQWFGEKNKVSICFLPTSKEDETTNIGCATVFIEILENAGLIKIKHKKIKIGGEDKEKLVVTEQIHQDCAYTRSADRRCYAIVFTHTKQT